MNFRELHSQKHCLLIGNVWDVASARAAEKMNYQAIGTSSAAMAAVLGYRDGQQMNFSELLHMTGRITANCKLPMTVDLEGGYGDDSDEVVENIVQLSQLGVAGVNIEDTVMGTERILSSPQEFSTKLAHIRGALDATQIDMFINVRTDPFLLEMPQALEECLERIKSYEHAGADGIFVPCVQREEDISAIVKSTTLPVNVMCMPNLPDLNTLHMLGVKRVSMGNFMFTHLHKELKEKFSAIIDNQSFSSIL